MQFSILTILAVVLGAVSLATAAPAAMPLPIRLAVKAEGSSPRARAPVAHPYDLRPWQVSVRR
ncbi:hypothetical protein BV20DRAFT_971795 [Pilatotrama ljubarskyi]|nr:hypothetical protein BV20DRAFT_971795 [Pilatotrama ljubarskyi]